MGSIEKAIYNRSERLLGADTMDLLAEKRVIIFGVGGVGGVGGCGSSSGLGGVGGVGGVGTWMALLILSISLS